MEKSEVFASSASLQGRAQAEFSPPGCRYSPKMVSILVVDDESLIRWSIARES